MTLISKTIPNLINGVSQQPSAIRMDSQAEEQVNALSSVVEGLRRRPATQNICKVFDTPIGDAYVHAINRDINERYIILITDGDLQVFDLEGNQKNITFPDGKEYLNIEGKPQKVFKALTIADYTFIVNTNKVVSMAAETSPSRGHEGIIFIKQASYKTTYKIFVDGVEKATHTTGDGFDTEDTKDRTADTIKIATALKTQLVENLGTGWSISLSQSTIYIKKSDSSSFKLQAEDSQGNTHIKAIKDKVQRFSDLPSVAVKDFTVEVVGDQSSNFDNYYVKFIPNNTNMTFDSGVWNETVKPGIPWKFDATTMPHILIRNADGTFTFKKADWGKRKFGDEESAPEPTFTNKKIQGLLFFKNRLGFLADTNCIFSQTSKFFDFFPSTVMTLVDSDPIDVSASSTKVSLLKAALAFQEDLILFSDQEQFILDYGDILSPKTASITTLTGFECDPSVQPVNAGKTMFLTVNKGAYASIKEYLVDSESDTKDAADITAHVPQYITGGVEQLVVSTNEDTLLCYSEQAPNTLFIYRYFWNGSEKVQSSWSKLIFPSVLKIFPIYFIGSEVILLTQYAQDGTYLEKMNFTPNYTDEGMPFEYLLDRKIDTNALINCSYSVETEKTTLVLPYNIAEEFQPTFKLVVKEATEIFPKGFELIGTFISPNTIEISGDITTVPIIMGLTFLSSYEFSPFIIKTTTEGGGLIPVDLGRLQLRNLYLNYNKTGYFEVKKKIKYRQEYLAKFTGKLIGSGSNVLGKIVLETGVFSTPLLSKNSTITVTIQSASYLPFYFTSASWEAYYNSLSQRLN